MSLTYEIDRDYQWGEYRLLVLDRARRVGITVRDLPVNSMLRADLSYALESIRREYRSTFHWLLKDARMVHPGDELPSITYSVLLSTHKYLNEGAPQ